jgi:hypothetical protein
LYERHFDLVDEMLEHNFENIKMPVLDYSLICFSGTKIKPWILTKAFINKIVHGIELTEEELQQLSLSNFYINLYDWLFTKK